MPKITMGEVFEDMKNEFLESLTDEQKCNLLIWCDEKIKSRDTTSLIWQDTPIRKDGVNKQTTESASPVPLLSKTTDILPDRI